MQEFQEFGESYAKYLGEKKKNQLARVKGIFIKICYFLTLALKETEFDVLLNIYSTPLV